MQEPIWIIVNRNGEQLHQFGSFTHNADAYRVLSKAQKLYPLAGCRVKQVQPENN